jgi:hypothetical protein
MTPLPFTLVNGLLTCIWDDRYEFFPDRESAERWALRQGFRAVFEEPDQRPCLCQDDIGYESGTCRWVNGGRPCEQEPRGIEYRFLGVMDLGEES